MRNHHLAAIPLAALLLTACASATDTAPLTTPHARTHRYRHPDPRRRGLRLAEPPRQQLQQRRRLL